MWKKIAIAAAIGGAVLGSGAAALAATSGTSGTSNATGSSAPGSTGATPTVGSSPATGATKAARTKIALKLRSFEHAQWVTKGKTGDVTHQAVEGLVTAVTPTSITVTAADGFNASYVVSTTTKVHVKGGSTSISGVAVNDRALVTAVSGPSTASTVTATRIVDAGPKK